MAKQTVYMKTADGNVFRTSHPEYHKECEALTRAEGERIYKAQTIAELRKVVKPGTRIYTKLESVSASGMSRRISLYVIRPATKGEPAYLSNISGSVATVTGYTHSDKGGVMAGGCGMDMGFAVVYELGRRLWPNGAPKGRGGKTDADGGYSLKHEWI